jgi:hypothetical protein
MGGKAVVELEESLHAEASEATGLDDFGDDYYREGLRRLLADLEQSTGDSESLRGAAEFVARGPLVGRLYAPRGWRDRPEVLSTPLLSPVLIVGLPRTGTTLLHKLLSMHDSFQVLPNWLVQNPMVRPPRQTWEQYPEYQAAAAFVASLPEIVHSTHFVAPDEADECLILMAQSFVSNFFGSINTLPSYDEWFLAEDMTPSFRRYAANLQLIGADEPHRRWLLKNPSNVLAMREFFLVFPDAKAIWTHRSPVAAMGSLVSLLSQFTADDPRDRANRELRLWSEGMRRTQEVRSDREEAFVDVDYRSLMADPLGVAISICRWLGMEVTSATEARMASWLEENPQGKHGEHRYEAAELGITDEAIRTAFAPYLARYDRD